jgi:hypothetical protein
MSGGKHAPLNSHLGLHLLPKNYNRDIGRLHIFVTIAARTSELELVGPAGFRALHEQKASGAFGCTGEINRLI